MLAFYIFNQLLNLAERRVVHNLICVKIKSCPTVEELLNLLCLHYVNNSIKTIICITGLMRLSIDLQTHVYFVSTQEQPFHQQSRSKISPVKHNI